MTLLNNILCPAYDVAVNLRKYMMVTAIITPKFIDLLNLILVQTHTEQKKLSQTCISNCRKTASVSDDISPDILRITASLYALWDNIAVAAPLKEKVQIRETYYAISRQQKDGFAPYHLEISACTQSGTDYITLSEEEICDELLDYAGETEAWLDEYSTDEEFDIFVEIQVELEFLARMLSEEI